MARKKKKKQNGLVAFLTVFALALTVVVVLIVLQIVKTGSSSSRQNASNTETESSVLITPTAAPVKNGDTITGTYYDPNTANLSESALAEAQAAEAKAAEEQPEDAAPAESEAVTPDAAPTQEESTETTTGETVYVTTTSVNVRSEPNTDGAILGQVSYGTDLVRTGETDGWSQIVYKDQTAYIKSDYVSTEEIEQTKWDLSELDNDPVNFGYSTANLDERNVPTDWEWYENKWGQFNVDWIQDTSSNTIYLTMDEGFGNDNTIKILDVLGEKGVNVTFFLTKNFVDERPELVQRMLDEGHQLGNHTCTHPNMPSLSLEDQTSQIMTLQDLVEEKYGYTMKLFRFPEGVYSNETLGLVNNCGLKAAFWSYAYVDYDENNQPPVDESLERALKYLHPGAIYLLHASSDTNTAMLADFIDGARERGYEFGRYPLTPN